MAKYNIVDTYGVVRASGYPTYHGAYGKPAYLEFNIYSPTPIAFAVGDGVEYRGQTFSLFSVPEPKKQARSGEAGDAFYYQGIQFHEQTRELENLIFTDLVKNSQGYFFSSRESTSTYENLAGIASRLEACISRQSESVWVVEVAPEVYSDTDLNAAASEPQEFPISGQSILDALNQVADIFKGIGWLYHYNNESDEHTITFGAPNVRSVAGTTGPFVYGKGGGLISLKKYITNKDKLCTRLYAYGSDRNMPPRYYNGKDIASAASVDIPNLMIPISEWGRTDNLPDAIKAFLEENSAVEAYGLIPRRVYFNNEENGDIYPSIKGMTIGDVENAIDSGTYTDIPYISPNTTYYPDASVRVDQISQAINPLDDGNIGDKTIRNISKSKNTPQINFTEAMTESAFGNINEFIATFDMGALTTKGTFTLGVGQNQVAWLVVRAEDTDGRFYTTHEEFEAAATFDVGVELRSNGVVLGRALCSKEYVGQTVVDGYDCFIYAMNLNAVSTIISNNEQYSNDVAVYLAGGIRVGAYSWFAMMTGSRINEQTAEADGPMQLSLAYTLAAIAKVYMRQIGFNLNDVTALNGAHGTLNVLDGMNGGRSFKIKICTYESLGDYYVLTLERVQDDSTGMLYPNATFPLQSGDKFVLTDIYMPDLYVARAENQLLAAAQSYYALNSSPKWLYTPEVDSSFLADGDAVMPKSGMYMELNDAEITGGTTEYILIDSVTIAEGDSSIPVVGVTLRERLNVPSAT
jgi:hypothetical protein